MLSSTLVIVFFTGSIYLSFLSTCLLVIQYSWYRLMYKIYLLVISKYIFTCHSVFLVPSFLQDLFTCIFQVHIYLAFSILGTVFFARSLYLSFVRNHLLATKYMSRRTIFAIRTVIISIKNTCEHSGVT